MLIMIACLEMSNGIGNKDGNLLFQIPKDMKHFRQTTNGSICVFGRKTAESLPKKKPLPNRKNIMLTRNVDNVIKGFETTNDINYILDLAKDNDVYICGGEEIYRQFIGYSDKMILTHVHEVNLEARTFFPDYDYKEWKLERKEKTEGKGKIPSFTIAEYSRVKK